MDGHNAAHGKRRVLRQESPPRQIPVRAEPFDKSAVRPGHPLLFPCNGSIVEGDGHFPQDMLVEAERERRCGPSTCSGRTLKGKGCPTGQRRGRGWAGTIAVILLTTGIAHAAVDVKEIVTKVEARYRATNDLTADFNQTTTVKGFATALKSAGRVYLKRPGKLRWDYLEPNLEQIFVENDYVQFYVPEHKQVLTGQLSKMADSQAPLQLLQGAARLDKHYAVAAVQDGTKGRLPLLSLTPLKGGPDQPRIIVEVDPASYFLRRVELHDVNGGISNIIFSNIRANTGIKDDFFVFSVPQDVEVVPAPKLVGP
jgi:outer membrane lipoprotein carrier protein